MNVSEVMTTNVITVTPDSAVLDAVQLMLQNRISGLPVVDKAARLVGIVSEGDFLRRVETATQRRRPRWLEFLIGPGRLAAEYVHAAGRKVDEIMTRDVQTVTEDTPLEKVVELMERYRIKRVPVLRDGALVGIVTRANMLRALAGLARQAPPTPASDGDIRSRVLSELERQAWAPIGQLNILVRNGVVELWGGITDERQRQAILVATENVPGVKHVVDQLVWIEPTSGMVLLPPDDEQPVAKAG